MSARPVTKTTINFLENYFSSVLISQSKKVNAGDKTVNPALIYEKIRNALEYQEEHLVFKNAVSRILRRKLTLFSGISADDLLTDLLNELSWANYLNLEKIEPEKAQEIKSRLETYLLLLKSARSVHLQKLEMNKIIINWFACEVDEILKPICDYNLLIDYTYFILVKNLDISKTKISTEENELQLKLAIFSLVFKPDNALVQYWLIKKSYPGFNRFSEDEIRKFGSGFDVHFNKINKTLNHPLRTRYFVYVKRCIAPFVLIKDLPTAKFVNLEKLQENHRPLIFSLLEIYDSSLTVTRLKVWRGTIRALIFIFLTKISLALLLEAPFDYYLLGQIKFLSLTINILLPPLLMLIAGTFVKSPSSKNRLYVSQAIENIVIEEKIGDKKFILARSQATPFDSIFNLIYWLVSLLIIAGVTWLLISLDFNILSIILFFIFVSIVSFFSFRIRNFALELAMVPTHNGGLTSTVEFVFSPFIRMGKYISERLGRSNPFIIALDFLIEAPLKTILKIMNSWFKFVNAKKEEIDL